MRREDRGTNLPQKRLPRGGPAPAQKGSIVTMKCQKCSLQDLYITKLINNNSKMTIYKTPKHDKNHYKGAAGGANPFPLIQLGGLESSPDFLAGLKGRTGEKKERRGGEGKGRTLNFEIFPPPVLTHGQTFTGGSRRHKAYSCSFANSSERCHADSFMPLRRVCL